MLDITGSDIIKSSDLIFDFRPTSDGKVFIVKKYVSIYYYFIYIFIDTCFVK